MANHIHKSSRHVPSAPHSMPTSLGRVGRSSHRAIRLIRDVSPTTALRAFSTGSLSIIKTDDDDESPSLQLDLHNVNSAERDLGKRVAEAAARLQAWCRELDSWRWSGTFVVSEDDQHQQAASGAESATSVETLEEEFGKILRDSDCTRYIPDVDVAAYNSRVRALEEELADEEFARLKYRVLGIYQARSHPGSSRSSSSLTMPSNSLTMMSDPELLVTHTLNQALQFVDLLRHHLDTWIVRLDILERAPSFLANLRPCERAVELAFKLIVLASGEDSPGTSSHALQALQTRLDSFLGSKVRMLGRELDRMLDMEGRVDKLPEKWIQRYEEVEEEYIRWRPDSQRSITERRERQEAQNRRREEAEGREKVEAERRETKQTDRTQREEADGREKGEAREEAENLADSKVPILQSFADNMARPVQGVGEKSLRWSVDSFQGSVETDDEAPEPMRAGNLDDANGSQHDVVQSSGIDGHKVQQSATEAPDVEQDAEFPDFAEDMGKSLESPSGIAETPSSAIPRGATDDVAVQRASTTSIRSISGIEIKRIQVSRSSSLSLPSTPLSNSFSLDRGGAHPLLPPTVTTCLASGNLPPTATTGLGSGNITPIKLPRTSYSMNHHNFILPGIHSPLEVTGEEVTTPERYPLEPPRKSRTEAPNAPVSPTPVVKEQDLPPDMDDDWAEIYDAAVEPETPTITIDGSPLHSSDVVTLTPGSPDSPTPLSSPLDSPQESPSQSASSRPLNAVMEKRHDKFKASTSLQTGTRHASAPVSAAPNTVAKSAKSTVNDLHQQISDILASLPTPIKLDKARRDSSVLSSSTDSSKHGMTPPLPHQRRGQTPSLILARAPTPLPSIHDENGGNPFRSSTPTFTNSRRTGNNTNLNVDRDTKLYYLTSARPGMAPIKLYVRRVGENGERVMVRVGGGWADLGEYLRNYIEHHGRRAVSDGLAGVEVSEAQQVQSSPTTKDSPGSVGGRQSSAGNHTPSSGAATDCGTPGPSSNMPPSASTPCADVAAPFPGSGGTPNSAGSTRSWGRHSHRGHAEVGLAGPKGRKQVELSDEKQEWVEGMVEKAKKGVGKKGEIGELGMVRGTRRIFMRGLGGKTDGA